MNFERTLGILAEFDGIYDVAVRKCTIAAEILHANGMDADTGRIGPQGRRSNACNRSCLVVAAFVARSVLIAVHTQHRQDGVREGNLDGLVLCADRLGD